MLSSIPVVTSAGLIPFKISGTSIFTRSVGVGITTGVIFAVDVLESTVVAGVLTGTAGVLVEGALDGVDGISGISTFTGVDEGIEGLLVRTEDPVVASTATAIGVVGATSIGGTSGIEVANFAAAATAPCNNRTSSRCRH